MLLNLKKVEKARKDAKKSVTEMGVLMGMNGASYWKKENGIHSFNANELPVLMKSLGKDINDLPEFFLYEDLPKSK
ncbi:helix-turn-helix domain-containing protein [Enterococcus sp. DIV0800]|uniref:helix-turn-helix domain-containing protein n=1 Tax=unclassified Enterococcus TaxID=2608891 RepID=UPI003D300C8D